LVAKESGGLGLVVWLVGVRGVQIIGALLRGTDRHVCKTQRMVWYWVFKELEEFCVSNLFIMLDYVLQKASTGVDHHYLYVWKRAHQGNADATKKLISINFYYYASFVISILNSIFYRTDIQRN
jgi:hypothetical protein